MDHRTSIAQPEDYVPQWLQNVDRLSFNEAVQRLLGFQELPPNRPDLSFADDGDIGTICFDAARHASAPSRVALQQTLGLTHDECCAIVAYTMENPYRLFQLLNAWMNSDRRDADVTRNVGPFASMLIRALMKLPVVTCPAGRAIKLNGIQVLEDIFANPKQHLPRGGKVNFWGFSSFSTDDKVLESPAFSRGKAILYKCAALTAVDVSPFSVLPNEREVLPIPPTMFQVQTYAKLGQVLIVSVELLSNDTFAYVEPSPTSNNSCDRTSMLCFDCGAPRHNVIGLKEPWCRACRCAPGGAWESTPKDALAVASYADVTTSLVVLPRILDAGYLAVLRVRDPCNVVCHNSKCFPHITWNRLRTLIVYRHGYLSEDPSEEGDDHHDDAAASLFCDTNRPALSRLRSLFMNSSHVSSSDIASMCALKHLCSLSLESDSITDALVKQLASSLHEQLHTLELRGCTQLTDAGIEPLKGFLRLQTLTLVACGRVTDDGIAHLSRLVHVQTLDLSCCTRITDAAIEHLKGFVQLQTLILNDLSEITNVGLALLGRFFAQLHSIGLNGCSRISNDGLFHLSALVHLRTLSLGHCSQITDVGIIHLVALSHLQALDLTCCDGITDSCLVSLGELSQLETLRVTQCTQITDEGMMHVQRLPQLRRLRLEGCTQVTDDGIAYLKSLPQLHTLRLDGCYQISDFGLRHLKGLLRLETLNVRICSQITDGGAMQLQGLVELRELSFHGCSGITDDAIVSLSTKLVQLRCLDLTDCCQISDAAVLQLKAFEHLHTLKMKGCLAISDTGIPFFKDVVSLRVLEIGGGTRITDTGVMYLTELGCLQSLRLTLQFNITNVGMSHLKRLVRQLNSLELIQCTKITEDCMADLFVCCTQLEELSMHGCRQITDLCLEKGVKGLNQLKTLDLSGCWRITDAGLVHLKALMQLQTLCLHGNSRISDAAVRRLIPHVDVEM